MRYQVPQFIEVEDKIVGPLTMRQFIYLGGGAGISYIVIRLIPSFFGLLLALPIAGLFLALAFYRPNDKPFINMLEAAFQYWIGSKLYIWKKQEVSAPTKALPTVKKKEEETNFYVPKLSNSKLKELTWSLDVNDNSMYTRGGTNTKK